MSDWIHLAQRLEGGAPLTAVVIEAKALVVIPVGNRLTKEAYDARVQVLTAIGDALQNGDSDLARLWETPRWDAGILDYTGFWRFAVSLRGVALAVATRRKIADLGLKPIS